MYKDLGSLEAVVIRHGGTTEVVKVSAGQTGRVWRVKGIAAQGRAETKRALSYCTRTRNTNQANREN